MFIREEKMKVLILLLFLLTISCSQGSARVESDRTSLADGRVSLKLPMNFKALTKDEIANKYPRGNAPQYVFANETQSVSIAITFSSTNLTNDKLEEFKESMKTMFERIIPGLQWKEREVVECNGRKWVHFKLISNAIDTEIINDMYFTPFDSKTLMLNFNSVVSQYEGIKQQLEECKSSIRINQ
jgi:uncharacterized protein YegJ (DUF2314 family)